MSSAFSELHAMFHGRQLPVDPVAALRIVAESLARGELPPERERKHVAAALLAHLDGHEPDLAAALGLRADLGKIAPARRARLDARDAALRDLVEQLPGSLTDKSEAVAQALAGRRELAQADLQADLDRIRQDFDGHLPASGRQVRRILRDGRS